MTNCQVVCPNHPIFCMDEAPKTFREAIGLFKESGEPSFIEAFFYGEEYPKGKWRGLLTDSARDVTGLTDVLYRARDAPSTKEMLDEMDRLTSTTITRKRQHDPDPTTPRSVRARIQSPSRLPGTPLLHRLRAVSPSPPPSHSPTPRPLPLLQLGNSAHSPVDVDEFGPFELPEPATTKHATSNPFIDSITNFPEGFQVSRLDGEVGVKLEERSDTLWHAGDEHDNAQTEPQLPPPFTHRSKWPFLFVCDMAAGFNRMEAMRVAHNNKISVPDLFVNSFQGCGKFSKSTFYNHWKFWEAATKEERDLYAAFGRTDHGKWLVFQDYIQPRIAAKDKLAKKHH